jgi:hypothetical protein
VEDPLRHGQAIGLGDADERGGADRLPPGRGEPAAHDAPEETAPAASPELGLELASPTAELVELDTALGVAVAASVWRCAVAVRECVAVALVGALAAEPLVADAFVAEPELAGVALTARVG